MKVVKVEAERVLNLVTNGGDSQDDVGSDNCTRYRDPAKFTIELERQKLFFFSLVSRGNQYIKEKSNNFKSRDDI